MHLILIILKKIFNKKLQSLLTSNTEKIVFFQSFIGWINFSFITVYLFGNN
jgi:hypothetical protein